MTAADATWMERALALAERGRGAVEPNPLVGAVVVRDGAAVGEGWHQQFGLAHAEINALAAAGDAARGATLYCTLEPCCHHGKTPPCTDALIRAGIKHVYAAMLDPYPEVAGKGMACLQQAGITVNMGLCESAARRLNAPYLKLVTTGRPFVHAKWAMTLDGKIATARGASKWISGAAARQWVHELRGKVDAILVGRGTAVADDPLLTARPAGARIALRIVLDSSASLPLGSRLVRSVSEAPVLVVTAPGADRSREEALRHAGCEVLALPHDDRAMALPALLDELGRRRFTNLLVEGGAQVLGSFCDARLVNRVHVFIAPRILGGHQALSPVAGHGAATVAQALPIRDWRYETVGDDLLIHGELNDE